MFEWSAPWVLAGLGLVPLIRWLHRFRELGTSQPVAALFLWASSATPPEGGLQRQPPDPRWRRRALLVALLVLAMAGPTLRTEAPTTVQVWWDDGVSMHTLEAGQSRHQIAATRLLQTLSDQGVTDIELRRLRGVGEVLRLQAGEASDHAAALAAWLAKPPDGADRPALPRLEQDRVHWLVSDGADHRVASWASLAPLQRVVPVGTATENLALTLLSVRPPADGNDAIEGLALVHNTGLAPAQARIKASAGADPLSSEVIELAPDANHPWRFSLPPGATAVRVELERVGDHIEALRLDDALELDTSTLGRSRRVLLDPACPSTLLHALGSHPRLTVLHDDSAAPDLVAACSAAAPGGSLPLLWLPPATSVHRMPTADAYWLDDPQRATSRLRFDAPPRINTAATADGTPALAVLDQPLALLAGEPRRILTVLLDLDDPALQTSAAFPQLVAGLLERLLGEETLAPHLAVERPLAAARIAPGSFSLSAQAADVTAATKAEPLSPWLLSAALLLILWEILAAARNRSARRAPTRLRSTGHWLALGAILGAAWNPSLPLGRGPVDLTLLIDESASMDREWLADAWAGVGAALDELPAGSRIDLVRFAADQSLEWQQAQPPAIPPAHWPQSRPLDPSVTDLYAALDLAAGLRDPSRTHRTLLLSDGRDTGSSPRPAAPPDELLWWRPPAADTGGARMLSLRAPDLVGPGESLEIQVAIEPSGQSGLALRAELAGVTRVLPLAPQPGPRHHLLSLPNPGPGLHQVMVSLAAADRVEPLERRNVAVEVAAPPRLVLLSHRDAGGVLAATLHNAGHSLTTLAPEQLGSDLLHTGDAVILDDIAVTDLPEAMWQLLAAEVRDRGLGLLVLGGPRAFAAGDYRRTTLESLLPVIAEPPQALPPAAVVFLVDQSGSMGRPGPAGGASRLALARAAVVGTARALQPADLVGLTSFSTEPRLEFALQPRDLALAALELEWSPGAQGGTRLAPAIEQAVDALEATPVRERLLVVVTDGIVDETESLMRSIAAGRDSSVRILVLEIGSGATGSDALAALARSGGGEVLRVGQESSLPRLMRQAVLQRRNPVGAGPVQPRALAALPLLPRSLTDWPPLDAYAVTRIRPGSKLYLAAPNGDPLLAAAPAGAGMAVALPGGLGEWADAWPAWVGWPRLVDALTQWVAARRLPGLALQPLGPNPADGFLLHAVDRDGAWLRETPRAQVRGPDGRTRTLEASPLAPGLYRLRPTHWAPGRYDLHVRIGERTRQRSYLYEPLDELRPGPVAELLETGLVDGRIHLWQPSSGFDPPTGHYPLRAPLAGLALAALLAVLLLERDLHRRVMPGRRHGGLGERRKPE